jgi:hypothetical protein
LAERAELAEAARWTALAAKQLRDAGQLVAASAADRVAKALSAQAEGTTLARKEADILVKQTSDLAASVQAGVIADAARWNAKAEDAFKQAAKTASDGVKAVIDEAAKVQGDTVQTLTKEAERIVVNVSVENKGILDTILGGLRSVGEGIVGAFADLGSLEIQALHAIFVDGIGAAIAQGMTQAIGEQMGMPFAHGVPIAEGMAAAAPEVVKRGSPEVRAGYERAVAAVQAELVEAIDKQIKELEAGHSPITPDEAFKAAGTISGAGLATYVGIAAASSAIEAATLGQVEIPGHFMLQLAGLYGLYKFIGTPVITAYDTAISKPLGYYYNAKFTPAVPPPGDIIKMLSRYKITPDQARVLQRYHGFGSHYDAWWEELAKTPLRYFALNAIARVGGYDRDFFEAELRRSGYSEEAIEKLHEAFKLMESTAEVRDGFSALRRLFKEGFDTAEGILLKWENYRTKKDPLERQLLVAQWEYEYDRKTDQRALILDQFERGVLTRADAMRELSSIMPAAERIVTLLDRAELKIKVERVPEPKEKVLTKSEILSALKNGVIDVSYAVDRLRAMRYSDEDIEILISLNLPRPKKAKVAG